jgi:hypothetical protein
MPSHTGLFRMTPTRALEVEALITPINLHLNYLQSRYTTRLGRLPPDNPVVIRFPDEIRPGNSNQANLAFSTPHKLPRHRRDPFLDHIAINQNREANLQCTRLWTIGCQFTVNSERIDPLFDPPWHQTEHNPDLANRIKFRIPLNSPEESFKDEWAEAHIEKLIELSLDVGALLVYTDGSLRPCSDTWTEISFPHSPIQKSFPLGLKWNHSQGMIHECLRNRWNDLLIPSFLHKMFVISSVLPITMPTSDVGKHFLDILCVQCLKNHHPIKQL